MDEQPPLFNVDVPPKRVRMRAEPSKARYTRWRPRTRQLCADCMQDIHERGIAVAPLPNPVRWRRTFGVESMGLCERHKSERLERGQ